MNVKARAELLGVGALVVGLFLGLTLLPWHFTGGVGNRLGAICWHGFGVGAVLLPVLGIGWALAAFGRLGSLSTLRAAALDGVDVRLLVPDEGDTSVHFQGTSPCHCAADTDYRVKRSRALA